MSNPDAGAKGGSGIGGNGAGVENGVVVAATSGKDGTGSGGGGGTSHVGGTSPAGKGGDGIVIIRLSGFVVKKVMVPEKGRSFVYDGTAKVGVDSTFYWSFEPSADVRKHAVATNADNYAVTVYINPRLSASVEWGDALGGRGPRIIPWKILQRAVEVPKRLPGFDPDNAQVKFNDTEKTAIDAGFHLLDEDGYCYTNLVAGVPVRFCRLVGHQRTDAGTTNYTATLCNYYDVTPQVTNFYWKTVTTGTKLDPQSVKWRIAPADNAIAGLTLGSWQEGTAPAAGKPSCSWTWQSVTTKYPNPDKVTYAWRLKGTLEWSEAKTTFDPPTGAGVYDLRAYICKDSNHEPGNWVEAESIIPFVIWRHPSAMLTDYVDITIKGYAGGSSAITEFPVLVRLKEAVNGGKGGGIPGFTYARAGDKGASLRFLSLSATGDYNIPETNRTEDAKQKDTLLPYEIEKWDDRGESLVWVKVPRISGKSTKFRMYWHRNPSAPLIADLPSTDTWANGYVGVWHLNNVTEAGVLPNSTAVGSALDAQGNVEILTPNSTKPSRISNAVLAKGDVMVPDYQPYMGSATSPFTMTGWYRGDNYQTGGSGVGRGNYMFTGKKQRLNPGENTGWCISINNNVTWYLPYANNLNFGNKQVSDVRSHWHQLVFKMPATGSSKTGMFYIDGANKTTSGGKTMSANNYAYLLVGETCAADEVRISKVDRPDTWIKAEYDTVNNPQFCTFGLVNRPDGENLERRVWVNWWKTEPTLERYWDIGELTQAKVNAGHGSLVVGSITNRFVKMPDEVEVAFPDASQIGAYTVEFYMFNSEAGISGSYPGPHVLFDGSRILDLEIVDHAPSPIDPGGPVASTLSGRILLANDDTTAAGAVAGQSYWRTKGADETLDPWWVHEGHTPPTSVVHNLRFGDRHELKHAEGGVTNTLWTLKDVYIGNMMLTNETASVSNRFNALPWSTTSKGISSQAAPFTYREAGQLVMRNIGTSENRPDLCAYIASPAYTNGIGTVYFDVVNAYALADVKKEGYQLVVEWTDNTNDVEFAAAEWRKAPLWAMKVSNGTLAAPMILDTLDCLNVKNGGRVNAFTFYRVFAKIDRRQPTRFRIRRTSALTDEGGNAREVNDPDGFILIDNVIASWPAPVPELRPTGAYDETRGGAAVLGMETAFSIPYPAAGESFFGRARLVGGTKENVSSARMHYRWRYADTEFMPERLNGRDAWNVVYFNITNSSFSTVSPLRYNGLHGDIEYWFDVTAFAPYYEYVDYSGQGLSAETAAQSKEEPEKNRPAVSDYGMYPSHGTNWFVRLREWPSEVRGFNFTYKTSADGAVTSVPMEMTGAKDWRYCLPTTAAVERIYVRLEEVTTLNPGASELAFATNRWSFDSAEELPKRLNRTTDGGWATVPCDAKANHLLFQLDGAKESLLVARADLQDFNLWSSAMTNLFVGSAVETNATSLLTKEEEADYSAWPISVATNSAWSENLKVGAAQIAAVIYPRNVPFSTARSQRGWTAENGMWTYGKWSLQNNANPLLSYGDDSALQLEGRGKGRLSFIDNTRSPDGLDTVTYSARVAQFNEFENFSYYNKYTVDLSGATPVVTPATDMTDYTFVTAAALTESGAESFDGDGSVSLVGYYRPGFGCYEFRVSRGRTATDIRLTLVRWSVQGGAFVSEELGHQDFDVADTGTGTEQNGINIKRLVKGAKTPLGGLFLSVEESGAGTLVTAGVYRKDLSTVGSVSAMNGQRFAVVNYLDTSARRLTCGTYGVLTCNCPGVIVKPSHYTKGVTSAVLSPTANKFTSNADTTVNFLGTFTPGEDTADYYRNWVEKPGRLERLTGHTAGSWGFQAMAVAPQKVVVQISESGKSVWTDVVTNTVSGFASSSQTIKIRDSRKCDVRLQMLGSPYDVRTDVVIDDVELTQWNGQWTQNYDQQSYGYLRDKFVYTSAWVTEEGGRKAVRLQPTRGKRDSSGNPLPISLRSPMLRGLGLINFKWRNADSHAKLLVQVNERVTAANIKALTESASIGEQSSSWETVATLDFSDPHSDLGPTGSKTVNLNRRYHGKEYGEDYYYCLVRVVVANDVAEAALGSAVKRNTPEYGQVEIYEAYAWDLPEYDVNSWSGWNFRTAGWNGADPDAWANLADGLRGLSGLLNNTLDPDTLADREKSHYALKSPGIQSPAFRTNCIGAVSFRARLYDKGDIDRSGHAAVVTVYGTSQFDPVTGEPVEGSWKEAGDVVVSNRIYTSFSVKLKVTENFKAVRLAVKGVPDVVAGGTAPEGYDPPNRVAIDDICLWERQPQSLAFRKYHVRPFRNADAIKTHMAVTDITSRNEQPIIGEAFGFQAEVLVQDEEEILTDDPNYPITVDLWYYTGSEPWGYENWKTNANAVRVTLTRAEEAPGQTNFIFRSTVESTASLCPPQLLEEGETHKLVQYHLVAHYYDKSHDAGVHELLKDDEWTAPEWYAGFADPNAAGSFSAYTLLEAIAPNRAWINEVNLTEDKKDTSTADQWVEIAVPSGVDMTGWKLRLYERDGYMADLLTFGNGCPASKQVSGDPSHYDFYVVKAPKSTLTADATWGKFTAGSVTEGVLNYCNPYGFELVRPSGVIEHSAVVQGWNLYREDYDRIAYLYDGTNLVSKLKEKKLGGDWVWADEDFHLMPGCTVGVTNNQGLVHEDWKSPMGRTPGALNEGQYIDPNWFVHPNGGYVWIYSRILGENMRQIIGGKTNTVGTLTVQSGTTTSIVYEVDRWYKLGECQVTPSWGNVTGPTVADGKSYYTLHLPDVSNQLDVTASAAVSDVVAALIPESARAYEPAVMNWLKRGVTGGADGGAHAFKNPDGPLVAAYYRGNNPLSPLPMDETNKLDLVAMYWFDLDPTAGGWELWGGMGDMPGAPGSLGTINCATNRVNAYGDVHTNILSTVWLQLTNTIDNVAYAPYRLQGLGNEQSDSFPGTWTSVTFQVKMQLANDSLQGVWRSMRYFVFGPGSFRAKDDPVSPYAARIEVIDPFSRQSPAWEWGWWKYADRGLKPFTKWGISSEVTPGGVSTLKKDDFYEF